MTPVINFNAHTRELLVQQFGHNKPFFVVRKETIIEEGKPFGERIYLSNGINTVTVPNVQGLSLGDGLYLAVEDSAVYEWQSHFEVRQPVVSNNQRTALSFGLHPIIHHKDSRNS